MIRSLAFVAALACAAPGFAQPPQKLSLTYDISYNGLVAAEITETLEHDGRRFSLTSEGRGKGLGALLYRGGARRACRGEITPAGLRPLEYRDQRGDKPPAVARFDWSAKTITHEHEGRSETVSLVPPLQDKLSFMYQFAFQKMPELQPGREIKLTVTDGRGLTQFHYSVAGKEVLKTPAGEIETVHLVKQRDGKEDKATELWFASARDYLPVRILVIENDGARVDQVLTRIGN